MIEQGAIDAFVGRIEGIEHARDFVLAPYTTFHIGGPADVMVYPRSEADVAKVIEAASQTKLPIFIMGGGSNLLISDKGIRGVVLRLKGALADIKVSESGDEIWAYAGASFPKLTHTALELGWKCALGWNGTPGQVGGALKMNAGTRLGEIGDVVKEVYCLSAEGPSVLTKEQIKFSYRNSQFPERAILTKARLFCAERFVDQVPELMASAKELADKRKKSQPKLRSAGSIFKNPPNDFAGRLIEAAGLKGAQEGGAQISTVHANFIVNANHAKAMDVLLLSKRVQKEVYEKFGVRLEHEVKLIGDFSAQEAA
jgi:UDP-N-acetylmuramate dehydrogenase